MVGRRGFIASLLVAPIAGKALQATRPALAEPVGLRGLSDDGTIVSVLYGEIESGTRHAAFGNEWAEATERYMFSGKG
jgi:hypothetical protein